MGTSWAQNRKEIPFLGVGVHSVWKIAVRRVVRAWGLSNLGTILAGVSCGMHHVGPGIGVDPGRVPRPDVPLFTPVQPSALGDTMPG